MVKPCGKEALDLVFWPGRDHSTPMCSEHLLAARRVADLLELKLAIQASLIPQACGGIDPEKP